MNNLAIITARGGSKRIPRKNIKLFLGKPIIAYSIEAAIKSNLFADVMVSTDDQEIAEISKKWGAKVPFYRSIENANDFATTNDVILEVILQYKSLGNNFDNACCIYPTAPFVNDEKLTEAYQILQKPDIDLVMPCVAYSFPILRSFTKDNTNMLSYAFPENINKRSQDLPQYFHDAGQFYFFKVKNYLQRKKLVSDKMYGMEFTELMVQDIDNENDWKMAELKYQLLTLEI